VGRQLTLNVDLIKKIARSVEQGNYFKVACELNGVNERTGREWLAIARRGDAEPIYLSFLASIKKAESKAEQSAIARIQQAGKGRKVIITKTKEIPTENGIIEVKEVTESVDVAWQADAWFLERKFPDRWNKSRIDQLEALKVLVDAGWFPEEILSMAHGEFSSFRKSVREIFSREFTGDRPSDQTT
jgi:hypothetical protein